MNTPRITLKGHMCILQLCEGTYEERQLRLHSYLGQLRKYQRAEVLTAKQYKEMSAYARILADA
jgi:hypothetical protein